MKRLESYELAGIGKRKKGIPAILRERFICLSFRYVRNVHSKDRKYMNSLCNSSHLEVVKEFDRECWNRDFV